MRERSKFVFWHGVKTRYKVSSTGKVYDTARKRYLKPRYDADRDVMRVRIDVKGHIYSPYIKNLVADAFIPVPEEHPDRVYVALIDGIPDHLTIDNLIRCSRNECYNIIEEPESGKRALRCVVEVESGKKFAGVTLAARKLDIPAWQIKLDLKHGFGKYRYEYVDLSEFSRLSA